MSQETIEVCDNCQKPFPESKIATHFGYCRRNIKKCQKCGEMYDINFLEEHEEEFHKMSQCKYCQKPFKPNEVQKHESICHARTQFCEYCELDVPMKNYPPHLKECESRTKPCQKCRKPIANKDFLIHSISCQGIVQEPIISIPTNKYSNYQQYIKDNQRKQQRKQEILPNRRQQTTKYQYKPSIMEQKREASRGGLQRQRKPEINNLNSRPMEMKKEIVHQPYKSPSIVKQSTTNYAEININRNVPTYDKRVPNIGQKDKYGKVEYGNKNNVEMGKYVNSGKVGENKYGLPSKISNNNEYQPSSAAMNNYGIKKPSNEPQQKIIPAVNINTNGRNVQQTTTINQALIRPSQQQPNISYPRVEEKYKKEIPTNKQVYVRRETDKIRQPEQQKKETNYAEFFANYDDAQYNFKKEDARRYKEPTRSKPSQQSYQPLGPQQTRPYNHPKPQQPTYIPPQQTTSYTGGSSFDMRDFDQDSQMQKAIMASLGSMTIQKSPKTNQSSNQRKQPKYKTDQAPADLVQNNMLNQSFYDNQMAIMQEIERNKNNKRR